MNSTYCVMLKHTLLNIQRHVVHSNRGLSTISSRPEYIERRNQLFNLEKKRQQESIGRVEKIDVNYIGTPEKAHLIMNKRISTPFDCAKHIGEIVMKRAAVALVNGETLWHMHRPLPESCTLDFLHFQIAQPALVNNVFWRTCSFLLGATASVAFKNNVNLHLHSFPSPNVRSGSFVYDVELGLEDWKPSQDELRVLSVEMLKIIQRNLQLEYLDVSVDLAQEMFKDNPHKSMQIPDIAVHNEQRVNLYRAGDHIDISKGPMLSNSSMIGRCTVAAVHKLPTNNLYRFQGVALPNDIRLNHFAYSILEERARKINSARLPGQGPVVDEQPIENRAAL